MLVIHDNLALPSSSAIQRFVTLAKEVGTYPLFPRLHALKAISTDQSKTNTFLICPLLYPKTLRVFEMNGVAPEVVDQCLRLLETQCPNLQIMRWGLVGDINLQPPSTATAPHFRHLTHVFFKCATEEPLNFLRYISTAALDLQLLYLTNRHPTPQSEIVGKLSNLTTVMLELPQGTGQPLTRAYVRLSTLGPLPRLTSLRMIQTEDTTTGHDLGHLCSGISSFSELRIIAITLNSQVTIEYRDISPVRQLHKLETFVLNHLNTRRGFIDLRWTDDDIEDFTSGLPNLVIFDVQTLSNFIDNPDEEEDEEAAQEPAQPLPPLASPLALSIFGKNCPGLKILRIRVHFGHCMEKGWMATKTLHPLWALQVLQLTDSPFFWEHPSIDELQTWDPQSDEFGERIMDVTNFLYDVCGPRTSVYAAQPEDWMGNQAWTQVLGAFAAKKRTAGHPSDVEETLVRYITAHKDGRSSDAATEQ